MRFTDIAAILARRISEGLYAVGSFMPTEKALMDEFDTSRHTVRAALQQLQDARLVSRRRGSGTMVEARTAPTGFAQSLGSLEDLVMLAATQPRQLKSARDVVMDLDTARTLKVDPGTRWVCFSSTRQGLDGAPMVLTDVYVDSRYGSIKQRVRSNPDALISSLIEEKYGLRIASVKQDISACILPDAVADKLDAPRGSPGLFIVRQYRDAAQHVIAASTSYHPADRYQFSTTLVRER
ncbi:GntR family transcriptional regulator [Pusillimonas sp. TS35]|uniref:GntR family transcriptional regulator n=1 Tax=Paracandidimonas lactea TaxID=2895524 RepID=UPI0013713E37|nr:GntR family transcriptional regulator [Paracandidimonas lactea]MYN12682.1 GntR family transcriptional regulator [Pusillimonas sp. TS35]